MCKSIVSLSKIAHQLWCDHPFGQKKQDSRKTSGVGGWRQQGMEGWVEQNLKGAGVGNIGGLHKVGG